MLLIQYEEPLEYNSSMMIIASFLRPGIPNQKHTCSCMPAFAYATAVAASINLICILLHKNPVIYKHEFLPSAFQLSTLWTSGMLLTEPAFTLSIYLLHSPRVKRRKRPHLTASNSRKLQRWRAKSLTASLRFFFPCAYSFSPTLALKFSFESTSKYHWTQRETQQSTHRSRALMLTGLGTQLCEALQTRARGIRLQPLPCLGTPGIVLVENVSSGKQTTH